MQNLGTLQQLFLGDLEDDGCLLKAQLITAADLNSCTDN
jgi:hypothetical protein